MEKKCKNFSPNVVFFNKKSFSRCRTKTTELIEMNVSQKWRYFRNAWFDICYFKFWLLIFFSLFNSYLIFLRVFTTIWIIFSIMCFFMQKKLKICWNINNYVHWRIIILWLVPPYFIDLNRKILLFLQFLMWVIPNFFISLKSKTKITLELRKNCFHVVLKGFILIFHASTLNLKIQK